MLNIIKKQSHYILRELFHIHTSLKKVAQTILNFPNGSNIMRYIRKFPYKGIKARLVNSIGIVYLPSSSLQLVESPA